jgi:hypothetical protein
MCRRGVDVRVHDTNDDDNVNFHHHHHVNCVDRILIHVVNQQSGMSTIDTKSCQTDDDQSSEYHEEDTTARNLDEQIDNVGVRDFFTDTNVIVTSQVVSSMVAKRWRDDIPYVRQFY